MRDLAHFFSYMNDVDFKYVVMRNWENLPYKVETGIHSDLDLLLYDLDHFLELFPHLEREYPHPRVRFKLTFESGEYVFLDARSVGDGYYPVEFQEAMLATREWNTNGFFTPNPLHHRIGLAYHVVHHKNANTYPNFLGSISVSKLLETLKQNPELSWVEPDDKSVGRFNPYARGATSVVSGNSEYVDKKQYRYKSYDLNANEARILKLLDSKYFPKLLKEEEGSIRIEHCGSPLSAENLPKDWRDQLHNILDELDRYKVVHRDVRLENLMIKDNQIKLLDFGWARLSDEPDGKHPDLLGFPNQCPLGFNDRYSMNRVINQLECELEDLCQKES